MRNHTYVLILQKKRNLFFYLKYFVQVENERFEKKKSCAIYHFYTERWVTVWIKNWTQQAAWKNFEYFRCSLICSQSEIDTNMEVWSWYSQIWRKRERQRKRHTYEIQVTTILSLTSLVDQFFVAYKYEM